MTDSDDMISDDIADDQLADQIAYEGQAGLPWDPMDDDCGEGDQFLSDGEADADALASAGFGTDEDYQHGDYCLGCED